jgi:hypothetical protein
MNNLLYSFDKHVQASFMGKYFELKKGDLKFGKANVISEINSLLLSPAISWPSISS